MFSLEMENDEDDLSVTLPDTLIIESPPASPVLRRANAVGPEELRDMVRRDSTQTNSSSGFFMLPRRQSSAAMSIPGGTPRSRSGSEDPVLLRRNATATAQNVIVGDMPPAKLPDPEEQFPMSMAPSSSFSPRGSGGRQ